ncbi:MAG: LysR family transcriptional regulator [Hyphomicrobiales bacterium]|nr:LysR family transcriptional regulator [Hyphomicrobiales bacterium]
MRINQVDFELLRSFCVLAEERHFGRAAKRLNISQPPLSRRIQKLEELLGCLLLERTQRRVELTAAGRVFMTKAEALLRQFQRAVYDTNSASRGMLGRLVLGFIHSTSYGLLPSILSRFREASPAVELELREMTIQEQQRALLDGHIDVGLLRPQRPPSDIAVSIIDREPFLAVLPSDHPLAARRSVSLQALADLPFILFPAATAPLFNERILEMCRRAGFAPQVAQEATQIHTVVGLVGAGIGVAVAPATAVRFRIPTVTCLPIEEGPPPVEVAVAWHRKRHTPVVECFIAAATSQHGVAPAAAMAPMAGHDDIARVLEERS